MSSAPARHTRFNPQRPFTRQEARNAGVGDAALRSRSFHKIFYDLYVSSDVPITTELRARAALKVADAGAHVSHDTAAELWGATPPMTPETHLSVPTANRRIVRDGVKSHVAHPEALITTLHGLPISTPEQTFLDLAASGTSLVNLVIVGDGLAKAEHTTPQQLIEAARLWTGRHRTPAVRAARFVRSGVDSPMETRLRLLLVLAGLPEPSVNVILRSENGEWRHRYDLCYPEWKLIVEYDGRQHAESPAQWDRDINRREDLDRMSWRILIVTSRGIYINPERTLVRVRDTLIECGAPGIRRHFTDEWRRHFPGSD